MYHAKRSNKAIKFEKWNYYNALYANNTSINQSPINNQKDDMNGNGYINRQRR